MTHTVYAITNDRGALYVGQTTDLARRLRQHNDGEGSTFTHAHGSRWRIVQTVKQPTLETAHEIEAKWTDELHRTGSLTFVSFPVQDYGPKTHIDHAQNYRISAAEREARAAAYEEALAASRAAAAELARKADERRKASEERKRAREERNRKALAHKFAQRHKITITEEGGIIRLAMPHDF